jgi:cytochrome b561
MKIIHQTLAVILLGLVAAHMAAALYHHVILRDDILRRMLPWRKRLRMSRADS